MKIDPKTPNLHAITALTDDVILLDVIGPPYGGDIECSYYIPGKLKNTLKQISDAPDLDCVPMEYKGHKVFTDEMGNLIDFRFLDQGVLDVQILNDKPMYV